MFDTLNKLLDLPREIRLGITWLVLATFVVGTDAYLIARFDRSLLTSLAQADALIASSPALGVMLRECLIAIAAFVVTWFYLMPVASFGWRQLIFECRLRLPHSWTKEARFPRREEGWQWVTAARIRAIEDNNAVLFDACERRLAESRRRDLVLRCVLATIVLSLLAWITSGPTTGPSLLGAGLRRRLPASRCPSCRQHPSRTR